MKAIFQYFILAGIIIVGTIIACANVSSEHTISVNTSSSKTTIKLNVPPTSEEFNTYWYTGKAELTSFELEQARYGEIHKGKAVLVYVTEDFNPEKQVKADQQRANNVPVLKLNATKKFYTGIYPYSIMTSTFYPISNKKHALKVTSSMQEWCGHVFTQLNNREKFELQSYSYFESESDQKFTLEKVILENELWNKLRIDPSQLPIGTLQMVPAFEIVRMKHIPLQAYKVIATLHTNGATATYTLEYPKLNRKLKIHYNTSFPYDIIGWTETQGDLTTKATKIKLLKSAYWSKNSVKDSILRKELGI